MTPAEKAQELYDKMENSIFIEPEPTWEGQCKQCALIAVDEITDALEKNGSWNYDYWEEVKQEIEKL
jgi:hypothetical protein